MGKDNVYFHSVFWPSILLGDGRPWTTLHHLSTTEYLQYESGKFSKSRGTGVFGAAAKHTGVPPSVWRYYLLSTRPETADSTFSWNDFVAANNNVLLNNFGNFVNRVLKFTQSKYSEGGVSKVPASNDPPGPIATTEIEGDPDPTFVSEINALLTEFINAMDAVKLRLGLQTVMLISARGNLYLQRSLLSNALFEEQPQRCAEVVSRSINLIYALSALIQPFMPSTSQSILEQLNAPPRIIPDKLSNNILSGHQLGKPAYLFTRIDPKKADEWRAMFGGNAPASAPTPVSKRKAVAAAKKEANTLGDIEKTSEILDLEAKIKAQGDKVRQIKEKKEPNIAEEVAVLKKLKENLQEVISKLPNVSTT
jgi:methionyl-tRNA synthetase